MQDASRTARKKIKTRQALIDAARLLVLEKRGGKISIQEITDKADVGLGTFYNYFTSKQEIYTAVLNSMVEEFRNGLSRLRSRLKDPATIVALTVKYCARESLLNEEWKNFLSFSKVKDEYYLEQTSEQCLADVLKGVKAGRFKVQDGDFARNLIQGMLRYVSREMTEGRMGIEAVNETASCVLRMLGIPDVVARAIVQIPLPAVAIDKTGMATRQSLEARIPNLQPEAEIAQSMTEKVSAKVSETNQEEQRAKSFSRTRNTGQSGVSI